MRYTSPTQLSELTALADRAQAHLAALLDDYETLDGPSLEYRLSILDRITDFIYRLTAVRKTLIALRASKQTNVSASVALTANIRAIHDQMLALQGDIHETKEFQKQRDAQYASPSPLAQCFPLQVPCGTAAPGGDLGISPSPNAACGRFTPNWRPSIDEIIPEPRIQDRADSPNPPTCPSPEQSASHKTHNSSLADNRCLNTVSETDQVTHLDSSCAADWSDLSPASHSLSPAEPADPFHAPADPQSKPAEPPDPLDTLAASINSRIPLSIADPDFQLPGSSNRAADYAPLYDLDLVPHTPCIPTLPLDAPDLAERLTTQLNHIESGCADSLCSIHTILDTSRQSLNHEVAETSPPFDSPSSSSTQPSPPTGPHCPAASHNESPGSSSVDFHSSSLFRAPPD